MKFSFRASILIFSFFLSLSACNTSAIFKKQTPHEQYREKLEAAGLGSTSLTKEWIRAAEEAVSNPVSISMPFREKGYFAAEKPSAAGYRFKVQRGMKISVALTRVKDTTARLFIDIWQIKDSARKQVPSVVELKDTLFKTIDADGDMLVRVQPGLLETAEYEIYINFGPSLAFPVDSSGKPSFISFWGASRDAGARHHEGVDIRASFRTPVIAAENGYARIADNRLGGKAVFLNSRANGYSLYYAHLDTQIVKDGQFVKVGDTVGLVGNTGNAKGTVPHLHFGIYTTTGAIDPLLFIQPNSLKTPDIKIRDTGNIWAHVTHQSNFDGNKSRSPREIPANTPVFIIGASDDSYRVRLPDKTEGYISGKTVALKPLKISQAAHTFVLLENPSMESTGKAIISQGSDIHIMGRINGFSLIIYNGLAGYAALP